MPGQQNFNQDEEEPVQEDLTFQVMPGGQLSEPVEHHAEQHTAPVMDSVQPLAEPRVHQGSFLNNKITYLIIGALVLAVLGAVAYFMLGGKEKEPVKPLSEINKVWMKQYFGVETCLDEISCGDKSDPDHDGLTNLEEYKVRKQTDPHNPDSDGDGLADGDEAHIYKTEPATKFTSCTNNNGVACQYDDGSQISNDYDPLTPGLKMTDTRKQQIASDTQAYKLHEPTTTTLKSKVTSATQAKTYNINVEAIGFTPPSLEVKVGDTVTWTNKGTTSIEIASDPHPTHTLLPELHSPSIVKDGTYSFVFSKAGTFGYHNHLNPALKGTVVVK